MNIMITWSSVKKIPDMIGVKKFYKTKSCGEVCGRWRLKSDQIHTFCPIVNKVCRNIHFYNESVEFCLIGGTLVRYDVISSFLR